MKSLIQSRLFIGRRQTVFSAVKQGKNESQVCALIEAGSDVDETDFRGQTALFCAVQQPNSDNIVRALIRSGADVNKTDFSRQTALFYAVQQVNSENVVHQLIDAGADVNKPDIHDLSPLVYTVRKVNNGSASVVRALTNAGADVNKADNRGQTALFYAVQQSNNENVVRALIDAGADVNKTYDGDRTVLFYAVQQSNSENVVRALIDGGIDVNKADNRGQTALFYSAQQNNNQCVLCVVIDAIADVNKTDKYGQSALFYAVQQNDNESVVRLLIDAGADVNKTDHRGRTALFYAIQRCNNERVFRALTDAGSDINKTDYRGRTALFYAVQQSNSENMVRALIDAGADVNKTDDNGQTALFHAVEQGENKEMVSALIDADVDVNKTDNCGQTALFYAVQKNIKNMICAILGAGVDINKSDYRGQTALFYAVQQSNGENMIRALIDAGVDINKTDNVGQTAIFYAVQQVVSANVVRLLIDAGADINNKKDYRGQTALFYAVQQNDNESVARLLIDAGADVNKTDNVGQTALFYAVQQSNNDSVVRALIGAGTDVLNTRDCYGRTPLFYACKCPGTFRHLVNAEVSQHLHVKDISNVSILTFLIEKFVMACLSSMDVNDLAKHFDLLIENGVSQEHIAKTVVNLIFTKIPFALVPGQSFSTLPVVVALATVYKKLFYFYSGASRKMQKIMAILETDLENENLFRVFELLFQLGADPSSVDSDGNTALHYVTRLPFFSVSQDIVIKMCHKLEELGASYNVKNLKGQSPLLFCLMGYCEENMAEHIMWILRKNHNLLSPAVKTLVNVCTFLVENGSSLEEVSLDGESLYHLLIKLFHKFLKLPDQTVRQDVLNEAIKLFEVFTPVEVAKRKIVNKRDSDLNSPLHLWASLTLATAQDYSSNVIPKYSFEEFVDKLLRNLLKCGAKANVRNENEETPLHLCRTWSAVKLLLDAGANPRDVDSSGRSALLVAAKNKIFENTDGFYPDISGDPKSFWKMAVEKGLEPWTNDQYGESVLNCLVQSDAFLLAKALVDVACEENYTESEAIFVSLLNAICKDTSTRTHWKVVLVQDLLKSRKRPITVYTPLRFCCTNLAQINKATNAEAIRSQNEDGLVSVDEFEAEHPVNSVKHISVHYEIAKLLLWSGIVVIPSGELFLDDIAATCPALQDLLTTPIDINTISLALPWTSVSNTFESRLAKVARRQEFEMVDSFWYHKDSIGSGTFGRVFVGINEKDGREVAIKRIETLRMNRSEDKREITNLTKLADCEQVVRYLHFIEREEFSFTVLELMEGNLDDYFRESFRANKAIGLCKDVVMGVRYLHQQNILHRDLKPTNILYKSHPKLCLKIADFGLSHCIDSFGKTTVYGTNVGTRCWIAPEVLTSATHSKLSDVFSCGLLLHYILSVQKHPFSPSDSMHKTDFQIALETEANVIHGKMEGWENSLFPEATDLVERMLANEKNIIERPTAREALQHPLFWSKEKKIDFLVAVGNQPEFECPRATRTHPYTAVEIGLQKEFNAIVRYGTWNDPGYTNMPVIFSEMIAPPGRRFYDTSSVVELVRFIRNAYAHVSDDKRSNPIRKMLLEDFVFLDYFPNLVVEVFNAVTENGWEQIKEEVKYSMKK